MAWKGKPSAFSEGSAGGDAVMTAGGFPGKGDGGGAVEVSWPVMKVCELRMLELLKETSTEREAEEETP